MSKHDIKARQIQVEELISPSGQLIAVRDKMQYEGVQEYDSPRDIPDIEKVQSLIGESGGGGSGSIETDLDITDQNSININWQVDPDPQGSEGQTYADRHGNSKIRVFGVAENQGVYSNYTPNLNYIKDTEGNITSVLITDLFTGILTII